MHYSFLNRTLRLRSRSCLQQVVLSFLGKCACSFAVVGFASLAKGSHRFARSPQAPSFLHPTYTYSR